jgi:hypothetical protein
MSAQNESQTASDFCSIGAGIVCIRRRRFRANPQQCVQVAKIEIDPAQLENCKAVVEEEIPQTGFELEMLGIST